MYKKVIGLFLVLTMSCVVYAFSNKKAEENTVSINKEKITQLVEANTRLSIIEISSSVLPNIAEVLTDQGVFYASYSGEYFIAGNIYRDSGAAGFVDIGEARFAEQRVAGLKNFKDNMIVYPAKDEKHVITVFTDITCIYCRKMHAKIAEYNDLGITVKYLAYPRSGVYDQSGQLSKGFQDLRSIWCNENKEEALTKAKSGGMVSHRICDASIEEQFDFARKVGVNSTPTVILENGSMFPGFREPNDLARMLVNM